jgi:hypothetical protein
MCTPGCHCGVQVDRWPDDGFSRCVFGGFVTAGMGVSVGGLQQEALLEDFYRSECSGTIQARRVHVFQDLLTVFNSSILTFGVQ